MPRFSDSPRGFLRETPSSQLRLRLETAHINVNYYLDQFEQLLRRADELDPQAQELCQLSRVLRMECESAAGSTNVTVNLETLERVHSAFHRAVERSTGSIYEANIAERAKRICDITRRMRERHAKDG